MNERDIGGGKPAADERGEETQMGAKCPES
jgi:hypothetical protein